MYCVRCKSKGVWALATVKSDNVWFCDDCFVEHILKKVRHNVRKYQMFKPGDVLAVGLSGGKDSSFMLHILNKLKDEFEVNIFGVHIYQGLGSYSEESLEAVRKQCKELNVNLTIVKPEIEIKRYGQRERCSVCGAVRRYYLNKVSRENGAAVLLTGHTLDDEVMYFLKNIISGELGYISKQYPVLEGYDGMVKRARPIFNIAEEDIRYYVNLHNINIVNSECPYVDRLRSNQKLAILNMEKQFKNFRRGFVKNMVEKIIPLLPKQEFNSLKQCIKCGEPTSNDVCLVCRLKGLKDRTHEPKMKRKKIKR